MKKRSLQELANITGWHFAQDQDGAIFGYECEPKQMKNQWKHTSGDFTRFSGKLVESYIGEWENSLTIPKRR